MRVLHLPSSDIIVVLIAIKYINMLSILVTATVLFIFGALWYTVMFGRMWARLMEFTPEQMAKGKEKGMTKPLIINFLLNVVTASVLYYVFPLLIALSLAEFIKIVLIVCVGFTLPQYVNQTLWESKSWKLIVLNSVHAVLYFGIGATVVYLMQ